MNIPFKKYFQICGQIKFYFIFIYTKLPRRLTQIKMTYKCEDKFVCYFPYPEGCFELFALQTDPVTELLKLESALCKEGTTLVPKLAHPLSIWTSGSTPSNLG
jgi:hypothetical protein